MYRHPFILVFFLIVQNLCAQKLEVDQLACNSKYNEFAPVSYNKGVVFCCDKPSRFGISWIDANGDFPTKIYYSEDKSISLLSENLVTKLNEGPACFSADGMQIIYTGTVRHGLSKNNNKLGLFFSNWTFEGWSEAFPFEHNSMDSTYSIAHPSLSADGMTLFFSSDMKDGYGGKDIYRCVKTGKGWSNPENMGPGINSSSNEIFPFIANDGRLYFTSDSKESTIDLDIYYSAFDKGKWSAPVRLPEPVNSESDDFSISLNADNESGYFTSNRNGKDDDIFSFRLSYPEFEACPPAESPTFCYLFEETNIIPNDSTPMIFEWELGDGTLAKGLSAEHCYTDFGSYHVALNVYDEKTRARFARVSEVDVQIEKSPNPFITSVDSAGIDSTVIISAAGTDLDGFETDQYYWSFGDGKRASGYEVSHVYTEPGYYTIQIGLTGKESDGVIPKRCATKQIAVGTAEQLAALNAGIDGQPRSSVLQEDMVFVEADSSQLLAYSPDSTVYFVEFKQSGSPIPLDDPYFNNIKYEITERFDSKDTAYRYSVGQTTEAEVMMRVYRDMISSGYLQSIVREEVARNFNTETKNSWWFIPDSMTTAINEHINKFNDIKFDLGTFMIRQESFDNLNYIAEVMNLQQSLKLKIKAHTDSIGTNSNNIILAKKRAQAVMEYLNSQGVKNNRMIPEGYGEESPVADNGSEAGRALNRRVEFEIIFEESRKAKK